MRLVRWLISLVKKDHGQHTPTISILMPYKYDGRRRHQTKKWVQKYLKANLRDAEIVEGHSKGKIFCKTEAFNDAARKAKGRVFVLYDADAYIDTKVIERCSQRILDNLDNHLWFVPYRHLFRLTKECSDLILLSDPADPVRLSSPPSRKCVEEYDKSMYGHRYGAMIMIIPREAYETLGCFDERFKGWGGEDVAILRALDTLYGKHKTTRNDLLHLWHQKVGKTYQTRVWKGQKKQQNNKLAQAYHRATRRPAQMRALVDEGCKHRMLRYRMRKQWEKFFNKGRGQ